MFELQHAVIITGQHAMHAERDTVLPYLSACLSVQPMLLYLNEWTYHGFNDLVGVSLIFEPHCYYKIPMRTPYRGVIYMGWKKIVIFDGNHCLSWRWYEIGPGYYGWRNQKS